MVATRAGKGLLDFAEAKASQRGEARAKYKQPVVQLGFAGQLPCAAKKQVGGDLNFASLFQRQRSSRSGNEETTENKTHKLSSKFQRLLIVQHLVC